MPADIGPALYVLGGGMPTSPGERHACALTTAGTVRCWGFGAFGSSVYGSVPADLPAVALGP
jgi:hypothetical protein